LFQIYYTVVSFLIVAHRRGHVEDGNLRWLSTEVCRRPFDPSDLPWIVSQRLFDPYRVGTKVYPAYQMGGRAARLTDNPGVMWVGTRS
jgi:hypothetical protein